MTARHISPKNLNLLPILQALGRERSVSAVARQLGLTQSAVSHALQRLRDEFHDDLYVRSAQGVVPTPLALELAPVVDQIVDSLAAVYNRGAAFDIKRAEARLTLATTDYVEAVVFPRLLETLRLEAPGIVIVSRSAMGVLPKSELEAGAFDLAVAGYFGELPEGFYKQELFADGFRSAVRRGHPALRGGKMTAKTFAEQDHVLISPQGDLRARMDQELKKQGLKRRVAIGVGGFLSPAWLVGQSDLVVTAPERVIKAYEQFFPVESFPSPLELPKIRIVQAWHERTHRSPVHKWFRAALMNAVGPT